MLNQNQDNDKDEEENTNKFHINLEAERSIWLDVIYGKYIPKVETCRKCNKNSFSIIDHNSIINPIYFCCNNKQCKSRHSLRNNTIFDKFPKTPASVLIDIIYWFIVENSNANIIKEKLINKYHLDAYNSNTIYNILDLIRRYITHYYRDKYILEKMYQGINGHFAVDECNFTHEGTEQVWVIGAIETSTKEIRIDIIHGRTANNIEKFIKKYIPSHSTVITDGWSGYQWMNRINSRYNHIVHSHAAGDFGYRLESTSHIESLWDNLKFLIKRMYNMIPSSNFYGFLKESEFRHNISNLNNMSKIDAIFDIFNYIANAYDNNPLKIEDLINSDY